MNPKTSQKDLSPKQLKALQGLMAGGTISSSALGADVSRSTVCRWLLQSDFRERLASERQEALYVVGRKLVKLGPSAVDALQLVIDSSESDAVKVRAATEGLGMLLRFAELQDVSERLSEVERRLTTAYGGSK
jgi:hypothetical protein